jgi:hypothetical protein
VVAGSVCEWVGDRASLHITKRAENAFVIRFGTCDLLSLAVTGSPKF